MHSKYAILLDGGFVTKALRRHINIFPTAGQVKNVCDRIAALPTLKNFELLRIYWYDAPPSSGLLKNPIDQTELNLGNTKIHAQHASLLDKLELQPNVALRLGETLVRSWRLGDSAFKELVRSPRQPVAKDFVPDIEQKGVDLRLG